MGGLNMTYVVPDIHGRFHAPQVLSDNGWPEQIKWLTDEATALGCMYAARAEILGE